jgi:hypothetical protein
LVAHEAQVFDMIAEGDVECGLDPVRPAVFDLDDNVVGIEHIDIVALQGVCSRAAVEGVGGAVALDEVFQSVASQRNGGTARRDEVFDEGCERMADRGLDPVGAAAILLLDEVVGAVDPVAIVARATPQGIGTGPPSRVSLPS